MNTTLPLIYNVWTFFALVQIHNAQTNISGCGSEMLKLKMIKQTISWYLFLSRLFPSQRSFTTTMEEQEWMKMNTQLIHWFQIERETERDREIETETETERARDRETEKETGRERERQRQRQRQTDRQIDRQTDRETETDRERDRQTDRETETDREGKQRETERERETGRAGREHFSDNFTILSNCVVYAHKISTQYITALLFSNIFKHCSTISPFTKVQYWIILNTEWLVSFIQFDLGDGY